MTGPHAARAGPSDMWRLRHNPVRPDVVRTDQPQPIDPLRVGQMGRAMDGAAVHDVTLQAHNGST